jgi:hypothetical protein
MTDDEGLSVRGAVDWCGSDVTVREITRLLWLDGAHQGGQNDASDERQAGRAGARRSATARGSSGRADARAGVDCLVDARFRGRGHARARTPLDWWPIVLAGTVVPSGTQSESRGYEASVFEPAVRVSRAGQCGAVVIGRGIRGTVQVFE